MYLEVTHTILILQNRLVVHLWINVLLVVLLYNLFTRYTFYRENSKLKTIDNVILWLIRRTEAS